MTNSMRLAERRHLKDGITMAEGTVGTILAGIMVGFVVGVGLSFWCVSRESMCSLG